MYDVAVVGGGPAGCHAASILSEHGLDVHVFEEHLIVGAPVNCSGVIGVDAFETLGLPDFLKLGDISNLTLVSPSESEVYFSPPAPIAHIVDRGVFDRTIADRTLKSGATFHFGSRVIDLCVTKDCAEIVVQKKGDDQSGIFNYDPLICKDYERLRATMVILADGPRYKLQSKLGMGGPSNILKTAQVEMPVIGLNETKIFMGSQIAPASFAWIVPFLKGKQQFAKIGVSSKNSATPFLKKFLEKLYSLGYLDSMNGSISSWIIPVSPIKRTFSDRVLAVGDAAGQTKPTTGGGLYYGLLCAAEAAKTIVAALKKRDYGAQFLRGYEKSWRRRLGWEIRTGVFFRRLVERLSDREIDELFKIARSNRFIAAVNKKARFDWHKNIIFLALRHPGLGRIFLKKIISK